MGTFRCWHSKEALVRDGGPEIDSTRECANERLDPACATAGWPWPSAAFLTSCKFK